MSQNVCSAYLVGLTDCLNFVKKVSLEIIPTSAKKMYRGCKADPKRSVYIFPPPIKKITSLSAKLLCNKIINFKANTNLAECMLYIRSTEKTC